MNGISWDKTAARATKQTIYLTNKQPLYYTLHECVTDKAIGSGNRFLHTTANSIFTAEDERSMFLRNVGTQL
jgi:hypothetical protein